jgi:DNA modification methylase
MRFTEEMEGRIHAVNCIDFIRELEPNWADAIVTGPSANKLGNWPKRERRWMIRFARALKFDGMLMLVGPPGWCEKQERAVRRAGFNVVCIVTAPGSSWSGREVMVAKLGDASDVLRLPQPWDIRCSRVQWGSSFPIEQAVALIEKYTQPAALVFDPFMGMGTTAMACERTGRRWVGCEAESGRAADAMRRIRQDIEWCEEAGIIIPPVGRVDVAASLVMQEGK